MSPSRKSPAAGKALPELHVLNGATARFECVFPSCGGICCKNGRPGISPGEGTRISANLKKFLPQLLPKARKLVETRGFLTRRVKEGRRTLAVSEGWCVFFNQGCVLHKVGAAEGQRFAYKPWHCVAFPLEKDARTGEWYVRQHGYRGEGWDLFCISPKESPKPALSTLGDELAFAAGIERGDEDWRRIGALPAPPAPAIPPSSSRGQGESAAAGVTPARGAEGAQARRAARRVTSKGRATSRSTGARPDQAAGKRGTPRGT
ncbi:MAG: DUF3109 family protein [Planctomycetes bacterium]|nr:DUF3109 family protein [Planctomycetota bacterium]